MEKEIAIPVGVLVERRKIDHPWAEWSWKPVAVTADLPDIEHWRVLAADAAVTRYYAGRADVVLHRRLAEAYLANLAGETPMLWVVLRRSEDAVGGIPWCVHTVSASPYDALHYLDPAEDIVEPVPMPHEVLGRLIAFLKAHPQEEEPFVKRVRDRVEPEEVKFSQQPIFARRERIPD